MKRLMVGLPATKPPDAPKSASTMFLAGPKARLRAKLTEKSKYRALVDIDPLLPAGHETLISAVPTLSLASAAGATSRYEANEEELRQFAAEIRETAKVFSSSQFLKGTLAERDKYVVWVSAWARLSGFGQYVVIDNTVRRGARIRSIFMFSWVKCHLVTDRPFMIHAGE